jgi:predicted amidophosphoribosyltransferase
MSSSRASPARSAKATPPRCACVGAGSAGRAHPSAPTKRNRRAERDRRVDLVALAVNAALLALVIVVLGRRSAKRFARRAWGGSERDRGLFASLAHVAAGAASSLSNGGRVPATLETPRCVQCGRYVRDSSNYCRACGTLLQPERGQSESQAPVAEGAAPILSIAGRVPASPGTPRCLRCGRYVRRSSDVCRACGTPRQPDGSRSESQAPVAEGAASILSIAGLMPATPGTPRCLRCGRYVRRSSDACGACGTPREPHPPRPRT